MDNNKKFWEKVAKLYTPLQEKSNKEIYGVVIKQCEKYLTGEQRVLELACGTGQFTFDLCSKAKSWEATDFSEKMVEETKKRSETVLSNKPNKVTEQGDAKASLTFSVQDATNLTYNDSTFDIVLIANALHIMPEPEKALSEIKRVLSPTGILIAPTFVYEGKINKFRMFIINLAGFKTYHKWNKSQFESFLESAGMNIKESEMISGRPLPECFVVAGKN